MAKDTEKLIRQLSLISYLMAQGRPTSALEIKREVEGYSDMNDDAFARRFYADRAELETLGITLQVEKPGDAIRLLTCIASLSRSFAGKNVSRSNAPSLSNAGFWIAWISPVMSSERP